MISSDAEEIQWLRDEIERLRYERVHEAKRADAKIEQLIGEIGRYRDEIAWLLRQMREMKRHVRHYGKDRALVRLLTRALKNSRVGK